MKLLSVLSPHRRQALHSQVGGPALSLTEGLDEFITVGMPYLKLAEGTRLAYRRDLTDLVKFLKTQHLSTWAEVDLPYLQRYVASLDYRKLSAATCNRRTWAIKKLFSFLFTSQYLNENPAERLVPVAVVRRDPAFLTEQEYTRFLEVVLEPRDRAIIMLYLQVGMNCSEVAGLAVTDVSLPSQISAQSDDVGYIQVKRRRRTQHLPLNWKVSEALKAWLDERAAIDTTEVLITEALFISRQYKAMVKRSIQSMIKRYEKKAGLRGVNSRKLRHTMATHYLAQGGDIQATQELLGLQTLDQMRGYVKVASKVQRKMVQELAL